MPRRRRHAPLRVHLNNRLVGQMAKETSGAISFHYDASWLDRAGAIPVSLSLPLREDAYRGEAVAAVFENLLPDSGSQRRRIAEQVGAEGSDSPAEDQVLFLKAQILFWLIGATDGHAKNFSLFLRPGGSFSLTPLYDVLTAQPSLDAGQIQAKQMKLAMSVGTDRHYSVDEIQARHFVQTADAVGLPKHIVRDAIGEIAETVEGAIGRVEAALPPGFPEHIHAAVKTAVRTKARRLSAGQDR